MRNLILNDLSYCGSVVIIGRKSELRNSDGIEGNTGRPVKAVTGKRAPLKILKVVNESVETTLMGASLALKSSRTSERLVIFQATWLHCLYTDDRATWKGIVCVSLLLVVKESYVWGDKRPASMSPCFAPSTAFQWSRALTAVVQDTDNDEQNQQ